MCNKHVHSTVTHSSCFQCLIGVINKPTTVELCISPVYRRLAVVKFSKSTMQKLLTWPWLRPLREHSLITRLRLHTADQCTKFEVSSISCCGFYMGCKNSKTGHLTMTMPLSGKIFHWQSGTCYGKSMYQIWSLQVHPLRSYEWQCKMQKMGWFGAIRGHSRSWAMSPFDRAHTTFYLTSTETMSLSCTVFDIAGYLSKVADFDPPHLHLAPP